MCGLQTRPRTDVDPPRFLSPSNYHRRGAYRLAAPAGRYVVGIALYTKSQYSSKQKKKKKANLLYLANSSQLDSIRPGWCSCADIAADRPPESAPQTDTTRRLYAHYWRRPRLTESTNASGRCPSTSVCLSRQRAPSNSIVRICYRVGQKVSCCTVVDISEARQ